ncbi:MAG TPA: LysR family transcriptional regulator [Terriglobales bacterium]|jgi:DNA-binding transcriptional LysR family regulator|nr:LysR family transcriptional regulator [Terriglobales bacterium]
MELFQLETFLAVAEEKSFSRAAKRLHRTQPAVSQVIRNLEEEVGELLLDRSSRDGTLTDAGRLLHEYAQELLNLRNEARQSLVELRQLQKGRLTIAANEYTSLYLLHVLHEFRRAYPTIHITIQRALASRVPQLLQEHAAELGTVSFRPEDPQLRSIVVYRDELAFVMPPTHPLAAAGNVNIRQLGAEVFVAHNVPSPYRAKVLQAFARHKTPLNMDVEMPTIDSIKKFVAMGNGVALVPGLAVEHEIARGELVRVPVSELNFERRLRIIYRRNATLSHAAQAFLKIVETLSSTKEGRFLFQAER